jgi:predicted nucleotidyltransferase
MISADTIIDFVETIATVALPQRVILFGSYADGSPNDDSDVDLLVVCDHRVGPSAKLLAFVGR